MIECKRCSKTNELTKTTIQNHSGLALTRPSQWGFAAPPKNVDGDLIHENSHSNNEINRYSNSGYKFDAFFEFSTLRNSIDFISDWHWYKVIIENTDGFDFVASIAKQNVLKINASKSLTNLKTCCEKFTHRDRKSAHGNAVESGLLFLDNL